MATVAEYFALLGLQPDEASFTLGDKLLDGVKSAATRAGVALAGAFALDSIKDFVAETISALPAIGDLANQTGFTAEQIQRLGFAASQSGSDADTMNASLSKLTKNIGEARKGGQGAVDAFAALGISVADLKRLNQGEILDRAADGLAKMGSRAEQAEVATALFGLSGAQLVPFLSQGADAIAALGDAADEAGLIIEADTIAAVDALDDSINASKATILGAARSLVLQMLPALEAGARGFAALAKVISKIPRFVNDNSKAIKILASIIGTILTAALLRSTVAFIANSAAAAINLLTLGGLVPLLPALAAAFQLAAAGATQLLLRFVAMAAPILAVAALLGIIILVVDDIITGLRGGDSFFGDFVGRFGELRDALAGVAGDDSFGIFVRAAAAAGAVLAGVFDFVDSEFDRFFRMLEGLVAIKDFVVGLFTDPVTTLKVFFLDSLAAFRDLVAQGLGLAAKVTSALASVTPDALGGANFAAASTALQSASTGVAAVNPAVNPVVRSITGATANSVSVAAPQVSVVVTGVSDAAAAAGAVVDAAPAALEQALRAAAVDLLPEAG